MKYDIEGTKIDLVTKIGLFIKSYRKEVMIIKVKIPP